MTQAGHITVVHGSLAVDVPRNLFVGKDCQVDWEASEPFRKLVMARYPWVTENSFKVLMNKARMEMMRVRDEETNGRDYSKTLAKKGKLDDAIEHLKIRLELNPNDPQGWYELGELYFEKGDTKSGFDAFHKADAYYKKH